MPIDNWGTPGRDTFQLEDHEYLLAFLASDNINFTPPYLAIQTKLNKKREPSRIRTWKKLFEKMGIVHIISKRLRLTDLGKILQTELNFPGHELLENNRTIARGVLQVLSKYSLINPTNKLPYPKNCNVFPYWTIWKVMNSLESKIHWEELNRVVLRIMRMDQIPKAIETIRSARTEKGYPNLLSENDFQRLLGKKVDLPQRSRAMSAILSEAGFGGSIVERKHRPDSYRYFNQIHHDLIEEFLCFQPTPKTYASKREWYDSYGVITQDSTFDKKPPFAPLKDSIENEIKAYSKDIIEAVLSFYLIEGKSHRNIQQEVLKLPAPAHGGGFKAMEILHYYGLSENSKGIFRGLPSLQNAKTLLQSYAPWIHPWQSAEILLILEGARAERQTDEAISNKIFSGETEIESTSTRRVRRQQNKLRDLILQIYGCKCAVCDISDRRLLRTSHIKPWAIDVDNRLNPENAVLLCALHDILFELGLMSFDDQMRVLFSINLQKTNSTFLKAAMQNTILFRDPVKHKPKIEFIRYHRENKFTRD